MKKLLCLIALAISFASCNDAKHIWVFQDMIYFLDNSSINEGYVEPVTKITASPQSDVDLLVIRNDFAAERYPKQTAKIVVEESLSTAKLGADFSLDNQVFNFQKKNALRLPLKVNIHNGTSGKKIVLKLEYGYYNECLLEGRKADKLTIIIK